LSAWLGNEIQQSAIKRIYAIRKRILETKDENLIHKWRKLQTSDHFYYMCTKWFSDGDVHKYFNPYGTPYDAFINYMNVLADFIIRVEENTKLGKGDFVEMKDAASELAEKAEKVVKKAARKASKKVKSSIEKGKDMKFDDIKEMSNASVKKLLKDVDVEHLTIALKDAEKELTEKVIPNLSAKAKKKFDEVNAEMKIKKSDIKKYRKSIEDKLKDIFGKK